MNINQCQNEDQKANLRTQYGEANKSVRKSAKEDKKHFIHEMTAEAERAAGQGNMKRLYEITRTLSGKNINANKHVRDKQGKVITSDTLNRENDGFNMFKKF